MLLDSKTKSKNSSRTIAKIFVGTFATIIFFFGGGFLIAGIIQGGGYFSSSSQRISTETSAMVTREIDVDGRRPVDAKNDPGDLARVRIQATSNNSKNVFIGVAKRSDVEKFLSNTSHVEMKTFNLDPFEVIWDEKKGSSKAPDPTKEKFWEATSTSVGDSSELQWNKSRGEGMIVAMNMDGSPGVDVTTNVGIRFGFLIPVGSAMLILSISAFGWLIITGTPKSKIDTPETNSSLNSKTL